MVIVNDGQSPTINNQQPLTNNQQPITKKLRVTTRRLRTMVLVFGEYYRPKHTRALFDGLRNLARHLGAAREADVLLSRAEDYMAGCDDESKKALAPFVSGADPTANKSLRGFTSLRARRISSSLGERFCRVCCCTPA
ncbi:MAG: CHAD domain-containing protein, partial [Anaerolineae bacterium]|nr:CHAD domain-containing protein [Anaerolineae bacterium]